MMNRYIKGTIGALALWLGFGVATYAQTISNQATEMTFQQSVEIPGKVLPPGTYWFTVLDEGPNGSPNRVQVKNADGTQVLATLMTENTDRAQLGQERGQGLERPTGKVIIRLAEGRPDQPLALLDWFYPGNAAGHKFVYAAKRQHELDEYKHETMAYDPGAKITIGSSQAAFK